MAKNEKKYKIPKTMKAWVLGNKEEVKLVEKPVPHPGPAEVLIHVDAVAICGTDIEILERGLPAMVEGGLPFNKNLTIGHEYMGTVVELGSGVDEFKVGDRVAVEVHAGCGRCERCREGMYTSCLNYGLNYGDKNKGHRANGFTTDGGFAEFAINHINTLVHVPDDMTDEEATLIVTAGTAMYGIDVLGGLIAGKSLLVMGPGPIGLMAVAVGKALGADPVILTGTRDERLELGKRLGADYVINIRKDDPIPKVKELCGGYGAHYIMECSGAVTALNDASKMIRRGGRICLAAFPPEPVMVDVPALVRNNIYIFGIRGEGQSATHRAASLMAQKKFDAKPLATHTFPLEELPTAIKYARERIEGAIKVVVKNKKLEPVS